MKSEESVLSDLPYSQLLEKYQEALAVISDHKMEIWELNQEIDDYCQALDELTDIIRVMKENMGECFRVFPFCQKQSGKLFHCQLANFFSVMSGKLIECQKLQSGKVFQHQSGILFG